MAEYSVRDIRSEDDLWAFLEEALAASESARDWTGIVIKGWEPELLYFPDDTIEGSFSPSTARALIDFHQSVSRAFAYLAHGRPDSRLLRDEEKAVLEIRILLKQGSNGFNVWDLALDTLVQGVIGKMTGDQIETVIIIFLLLFFGQSFARYWIRRHYEEKSRDGAASERLAMTAEETRRSQIMADALTRHPHLQPLVDEADKSKVALLKGAAAADRARVEGTPITGEEARTILDKERGTGDGRRIDGVFKVESIDVEHETGFVVRLRNTDTGEEFNAEANVGEMPMEDIHNIFAAAEAKAMISARINGWYVDDRIARASIVRADKSE